MAGVTINPALVTNAQNSFAVQSTGYVQGVLLDDPVTRYKLNQGIVSSAATTPFWGGMGITASLWNPANQSDSIGYVLTLASAEANLIGFTVYNQSTAMIQSPQSPCPLAPQSGAINFVMLGSGARIAVACSNAVATAYEGGSVITAAYWDYTNQVLLGSPGGTAIGIYGAVKVVDVNVGGSMTVNYNSGTGFATWTRNGSVAILEI